MARKAHKDGEKPVKYVKLKHHHSKPYRKRHVGGLVFFGIATIVVVYTLITYRLAIQAGVTRARSFAQTLFGGPTINTTAVDSTYGFGFDYDNQAFYASGLDVASGNLYYDNELAVKRAYDTIRISQHTNDRNGSLTSVKVRYLDKVVAQSLADASLKNVDRNELLAGIDVKNVSVTERSRSKVSLGGQDFTKVEWQMKSKLNTTVTLSTYATTYLGVVNKRAFVVAINTGVEETDADFKSIVNSLRFGTRTQAFGKIDDNVASALDQKRSLMDSLLGVGVARAAAAAQPSSAEKFSALYSPAVVKVYNFYCMDVMVHGEDASFHLTNYCSLGSGSGFFVSSDGVLATNGHVATSNPKDAVIMYALQQFIKGDGRFLIVLAHLANVTDSDLHQGMSELEVVDVIVEKAYAMPDSSFEMSNNISNLLVDLGDKQPDVEELAVDTEKRQKYPEQDGVKAGTLLGADYRAINIQAYKKSDVALVKVSGANFPVVKLGSIDGLVQGSDIFILGYPGNASDNGIVSADQGKVTLTAGKVSSVKNAKGSTKKLVETDTTIGHGNSGGPAFDSNGKVFGIATYGVDNSRGSGAGEYNYLRDIQDLKDLASQTSVTMNASSTTQTEWEKGITQFYASHYKSAVATFNKVKALYPSHSKADEFIAAANEHIKNGEDVPEIPVTGIVIVGVLVLAGAGGAAFMIMRQRKMHGIYNAHVASGTIAPMTPGAAPVVVPAQPAVVAPTAAPAAPAAGPAAPVITMPSDRPAAPAVTTVPVQPAQTTQPQNPNQRLK